MTIKQFLDYLEPGEWLLDSDGNLMDLDDNCPLWHVYRRYFDDFDEDESEGAEDYVAAGRACGLRTRDAIAIAQAADNRGHPRLRTRLLSATGVIEEHANG